MVSHAMIDSDVLLAYPNIEVQMPITDEEWNEMNAIRQAIKDHPASVHPDKMERFTELFVRSLGTASDERVLDKPFFP